MNSYEDSGFLPSLGKFKCIYVHIDIYVCACLCVCTCTHNVKLKKISFIKTLIGENIETLNLETVLLAQLLSYFFYLLSLFC